MIMDCFGLLVRFSSKHLFTARKRLVKICVYEQVFVRLHCFIHDESNFYDCMVGGWGEERMFQS